MLPKSQGSLLLNYGACESPKNHSLIVPKIYYNFPDYLSSSAKYFMKMLKLKIDPGL